MLIKLALGLAVGGLVGLGLVHAWDLLRARGWSAPARCAIFFGGFILFCFLIWALLLAH